MKQTCASLMWVAILMTRAASADDSGPYVSAGIGFADTPSNSLLVTPDVPPLTGKADDNDVSWSGALGYRFNRNIALELGYVDLGERESELADASGLTDARADLAFAADGVTLALIGTVPFGRWEPYLKAGVLFSNTALAYSGTMTGAAFGARLKNENEDPLYGIGIRYAVLEHLQIFLDATFLDQVGEPETGRSDYFNTSAGVIWRF